LYCCRYEECTARDDPQCRLWCSVSNDHGHHRARHSRWAYCNTSCPYSKNDKWDDWGCGKLEPHFFADEFSTIELASSEDPNFEWHEDEYDY